MCAWDGAVANGDLSKESGHDSGTASDVAGSDQTGLADCGYRSFAGLKRGQSGDVACCAVAVTGGNGQLLGLRGGEGDGGRRNGNAGKRWGICCTVG